MMKLSARPTYLIVVGATLLIFRWST